MRKHLSVWSKGHPAATRHTETIDVILALRERAPWAVGRVLIEGAGIDPGSGWDAALQDVKVRDETDTSIDLDRLYQGYLSHVCCGEKSLRMYELAGWDADRLRAELKSNFSLNRLPRPRLKTDLRRAPLEGPKLVFAAHIEGTSVGVFATIRSYEERVEIDPNSLPIATRSTLPDFDELLAVRSVMYEAYGAIVVPDTANVAEVRVDAKVDETIHGINTFHQVMYSQLHHMSQSSAVISPVNLFGAIKSLYADKSEGIVSELSFATTTGSVKHEKMRSHESLRQETFHVGGVQALATDIEPFQISVRWRHQTAGSKRVTSPELSLRGSLSMIGSPSPQLHTAAIHKTGTFDEFHFVRDKLVKHA
jgi:hypothetical protein